MPRKRLRSEDFYLSPSTALPLTISNESSLVEFSNEPIALSRLLHWTIRLRKNYVRLATVFGNYCRYTVTSSENGNRLAALAGKNNGVEQPAVRIKARWQSVEILPLRAYDDLQHFLTYNYLPLCQQLEPILSVKSKEDFATTLVRILHRQKLAKDFLCDLIMSEINLLENDHLMFRGNSLATKAMEAYMKLIADDFLQETLGEFIRDVLSSEESCEVDPLKLNGVPPTVLDKNRLLLTRWVERTWSRILINTNSMPAELREVFCALRDRLEGLRRGDLADTLISSSIFLRYLCPAILSPSLFNLCSEYPSNVTSRNLTLIAKTLQNLANFTKFGGKEHYMEFMNTFVDREWHRMREYLLRISAGPCPMPDSDVRVDLGRELSLLTSYLEESWTTEVHERASSDRRLVDLKGIMADLREYKRRSASYGSHSPMTQQNSSDYENSPQHNVVRTRSENVPAYRSTPPTGQATVIARSRPAIHLMTSDDYVTSSALTPPRNHHLRSNEDTVTTSSRTSEKTSSSGEARDTDSDGEVRTERWRLRKTKRRMDSSENGSLPPPSSGYHSNNHSSYSNSSSSSPVERLASMSIASEVVPGPSGYSYSAAAYTPPSTYDNDVMAGNLYAVPPDCDVTPRNAGKTNLPRTNPRASRASSSTLLRPTVIDVTPEDWNRSISTPSRESIYNNNSYKNLAMEISPEKIIEQQRREIERLIRENAELKRHIGEKKSLHKDERVDSGASEDSYDSLGSLDRPLKAVA